MPAYTTSIAIQTSTSLVYAIETTTFTRRVTSTLFQTSTQIISGDAPNFDPQLTLTVARCSSADTQPSPTVSAAALASPTLPGTVSSCTHTPFPLFLKRHTRLGR